MTCFSPINILNFIIIKLNRENLIKLTKMEDLCICYVPCMY